MTPPEMFDEPLTPEPYIVMLDDVLYRVTAIDAPTAAARVLAAIGWTPPPPPEVPSETDVLDSEWPEGCVVHTQHDYLEIYGPLGDLHDID